MIFEYMRLSKRCESCVIAFRERGIIRVTRRIILGIVAVLIVSSISGCSLWKAAPPDSGEEPTVTYVELFKDDFDSYNEGANSWQAVILEKWPARHIGSGETNVHVVTADRFASPPHSMEINPHLGNGHYLRTYTIEVDDTKDLMFELKFYSEQTGFSIDGFTDGWKNLFKLRLDDDGEVAYSTATQYVTIANAVWKKNEWNHFRIVVRANAGTWELYIDDMNTPIITDVSLLTAIAQSSVMFGVMSGTDTFYIDDVGVYQVEDV